ncbi:MAG: peptidoglycan-binding protein [Pseudomonadota bacterium]
MLVGIGAVAAFVLLAAGGSYAGHMAAKATKKGPAPSTYQVAVANHAGVVIPDTDADGPCAAFAPGQCPEPLQAQELRRQAQYYLHRGDAEVAVGRRDEARSFYSRAVVIGRTAEAPSADLATRRLNFLELACADGEVSSAPIGTPEQQRALRALGYHQGRTELLHGQALSDAIRAFQSDLWLDATGRLSAAESVLLMCGAAELAKDAASQRQLGLLYAAGHGVERDTARGIELLEEASLRGDAVASWNLALLYGAGMLADRSSVCGVERDLDRADQYLAEAALAGDQRAVAFDDFVRGQSAPERWQQVYDAMSRPGQTAGSCNLQG